MLDKNTLKYSQDAGREALETAIQLDLAPSPQVFEVLQAYFMGTNQVLAAEVGRILALPGNQIERQLLLLHTEHFGHQALEKALERVRSGLETEIASVSEKLNGGIKGNLSLAGELRKAIRDIAGTITREELQTVCKHVVLQSRAHLNDTQSVALKLERTQFQLEEMQRELAALRDAASKDHLTGLPNRRYLDEKLDQILSSGETFCFAILDIDHFKSVNDTWGHSAGDNILRGIGQLLHHNTKGKDFAARIGGEEFALLLPSTPIAGAFILCETIRSRCAEVTWISQQTEREIGNLSLSIGLTERLPGDTAASIYERADTLLYRAKADGRNRVIRAA